MLIQITLALILGLAVDPDSSLKKDGDDQSSATDQDLPLKLTNNTWVYTYGVTRPLILCSPLHVCDIALQPGERVKNYSAGDTSRWLFSSSVSGEGDNLQRHILVKPTRSGIETSLLIHTSRRSYNLELSSSSNNYMARVVFRYPEYEEKIRLEKIIKEETLRNQKIKREEKEKKAAEQAKKLPRSSWNIENISFAYTVRGNAPWKPLRVYSNAEKTIIEFPKTIAQHDAPVLLLLERFGWFRTKKSRVNYRIKNNLYIVDRVFKRALLVSGVGRNKHKVVIIKD